MTISLCEEIPGIVKDIDRFVKRKADRYGETAFDGEEFTLIAWPEETTDEDVFAIDSFRMDGIHIGGIYSTRWLEYLKAHTRPAETEETEDE